MKAFFFRCGVVLLLLACIVHVSTAGSCTCDCVKGGFKDNVCPTQCDGCDERNTALCECDNPCESGGCGSGYKEIDSDKCCKRVVFVCVNAEKCQKLDCGKEKYQCTKCASGYYGDDCTKCSSCNNHGSCNDGKDGDGSCLCPSGYNPSTRCRYCTNTLYDPSKSCAYCLNDRFDRSAGCATCVSNRYAYPTCRYCNHDDCGSSSCGSAGFCVCPTGVGEYETVDGERGTTSCNGCALEDNYYGLSDGSWYWCRQCTDVGTCRNRGECTSNGFHAVENKECNVSRTDVSVASDTSAHASADACLRACVEHNGCVATEWTPTADTTVRCALVTGTLASLSEGGEPALGTTCNIKVQCHLCVSDSAGPTCQYTRSKTCKGNGVPQDDGSCVCDSTWFGPTCAVKCTDATCNNNGVCDPNSGQCNCFSAYSGNADCSECAEEYVRTTDGSCVWCNAAYCNNNVVDTAAPCDSSGSCICKDPYASTNCSIDLSAVECNGHAVTTRLSDDGLRGECDCQSKYSPDFDELENAGCFECAADRYNYPECSYCDAATCSGNGTCAQTGGCTCNDNFQGDSCDECVYGHYGSKCDVYCTPEANCTRADRGSCSVDGTECVCKGNFAGLDCGSCKNNYYPSSDCSRLCIDDGTALDTCSGVGTCDPTTGYCICNAGFNGSSCERDARPFTAPQNVRLQSAATFTAATVLWDEPAANGREVIGVELQLVQRYSAQAGVSYSKSPPVYSYSTTDLQPATSYAVSVKFVYTDGTSLPSTILYFSTVGSANVGIPVLQVGEPPRDVAENLPIQWSSPPGVTWTDVPTDTTVWYIVERSLRATSGFQVVGSVPVTQEYATFTDSDLQLDKEKDKAAVYFYRISCVAESTHYCASSTGRVQVPGRAAPRSFRVEGSYDRHSQTGSFSLVWTPPSEEEDSSLPSSEYQITGYTLQVKKVVDESEQEIPTSPYALAPSDSYDLILDDPMLGTTYVFRIAAIDADGEGTFAAASTSLASVTNAPFGEWVGTVVPIADVQTQIAGEASASVLGLAESSFYLFRVKAQNDLGYSPPSAQLLARTYTGKYPAPDAFGLAAITTEDTVSLQWQLHPISGLYISAPPTAYKVTWRALYTEDRLHSINEWSTFTYDLSTGVPLDGTQFTCTTVVEGLQGDMSYIFRVYTYSEELEEGYPAELFVRTDTYQGNTCRQPQDILSNVGEADASSSSTHNFNLGYAYFPLSGRNFASSAPDSTGTSTPDGCSSEVSDTELAMSHVHWFGFRGMGHVVTLNLCNAPETVKPYLMALPFVYTDSSVCPQGRVEAVTATTLPTGAVSCFPYYRVQTDCNAGTAFSFYAAHNVRYRIAVGLSPWEEAQLPLNNAGISLSMQVTTTKLIPSLEWNVEYYGSSVDLSPFADGSDSNVFQRDITTKVGLVTRSAHYANQEVHLPVVHYMQIQRRNDFGNLVLEGKQNLEETISWSSAGIFPFLKKNFSSETLTQTSSQQVTANREDIEAQNIDITTSTTMGPVGTTGDWPVYPNDLRTEHKTQNLKFSDPAKDIAEVTGASDPFLHVAGVLSGSLTFRMEAEIPLTALYCTITFYGAVRSNGPGPTGCEFSINRNNMPTSAGQYPILIEYYVISTLLTTTTRQITKPVYVVESPPLFAAAVGQSGTELGSLYVELEFRVDVPSASAPGYYVARAFKVALSPSYASGLGLVSLKLSASESAGAGLRGIDLKKFGLQLDVDGSLERTGSYDVLVPSAGLELSVEASIYGTVKRIFFSVEVSGLLSAEFYAFVTIGISATWTEVVGATAGQGGELTEPTGTVEIVPSVEVGLGAEVELIVGSVTVTASIILSMTIEVGGDTTYSVSGVIKIDACAWFMCYEHEIAQDFIASMAPYQGHHHHNAKEQHKDAKAAAAHFARKLARAPYTRRRTMPHSRKVRRTFKGTQHIQTSTYLRRHMLALNLPHPTRVHPLEQIRHARAFRKKLSAHKRQGGSITQEELHVKNADECEASAMLSYDNILQGTVMEDGFTAANPRVASFKALHDGIEQPVSVAVWSAEDTDTDTTCVHKSCPNHFAIEFGFYRTHCWQGVSYLSATSYPEYGADVAAFQAPTGSPQTLAVYERYWDSSDLDPLTVDIDQDRGLRGAIFQSFDYTTATWSAAVPLPGSDDTSKPQMNPRLSALAGAQATTPSDALTHPFIVTALTSTLDAADPTNNVNQPVTVMVSTFDASTGAFSEFIHLSNPTDVVRTTAFDTTYFVHPVTNEAVHAILLPAKSDSGSTPVLMVKRAASGTYTAISMPGAPDGDISKLLLTSDANGRLVVVWRAKGANAEYLLIDITTATSPVFVGPTSLGVGASTDDTGSTVFALSGGGDASVVLSYTQQLITEGRQVSSFSSLQGDEFTSPLEVDRVFNNAVSQPVLTTQARFTEDGTTAHSLLLLDVVSVTTPQNPESKATSLIFDQSNIDFTEISFVMDLTLSSVHVGEIFQDTAADNTYKATITVTVTNKGLWVSTPTALQLQLGSAQGVDPDFPATTGEYIPSMLPGASVDLDVDVSFSSEHAFKGYIWITIDPDDAVEEMSTANNVIAVPLTRPAFANEAVTLTPASTSANGESCATSDFSDLSLSVGFSLKNTLALPILSIATTVRVCPTATKTDTSSCLAETSVVSRSSAAVDEVVTVPLSQLAAAGPQSLSLLIEAAVPKVPTAAVSNPLLPFTASSVSLTYSQASLTTGQEIEFMTNPQDNLFFADSTSVTTLNGNEGFASYQVSVQQRGAQCTDTSVVLYAKKKDAGGAAFSDASDSPQSAWTHTDIINAGYEEWGRASVAVPPMGSGTATIGASHVRLPTGTSSQSYRILAHVDPDQLVQDVDRADNTIEILSDLVGGATVDMNVVRASLYTPDAQEQATLRVTVSYTSLGALNELQASVSYHRVGTDGSDSTQDVALGTVDFGSDFSGCLYFSLPLDTQWSSRSQLLSADASSSYFIVSLTDVSENELATTLVLPQASVQSESLFDCSDRVDISVVGVPRTNNDERTWQATNAGPTDVTLKDPFGNAIVVVPALSNIQFTTDVVSTLEYYYTVRLTEDQGTAVANQNLLLTCTTSSMSVSTDEGSDQATVVYTPTPTCTSEGCSVSCFPISGSVFELGTTSVTCSATDSTSATASCPFSVTVTDNEAPTLTCASPITSCASDSSPSSTTQPFGASATDNVDAINEITIVPTEGLLDAYPIGENIITYKATDSAGNFAVCTTKVTVIDCSPPALSCSDVNTNTDPGVATSAIASYDSNVACSDNVGCGPVLCTPAAPHAFDVGTTTVSCSATDGTYTSTCEFTVTVSDNQNPTITNCPADVVVPTDAGVATAAVSWDDPTTTDNVAVTSVVASPLVSGSAFPLGVTTETIVASDAAGRTASCSFKVTVQDKEAPVVSGCPASFSIGSDAVIPYPGGASASWTAPTAIDNVDGTSLEADINPTVSPGDVFPIGETAIAYSFDDNAGNAAPDCLFSVTVVDDDAPVIGSCPSCIHKSTDAGAAGALVTWDDPTATDNSVQGALSYTNYETSSASILNKGDLFPVGKTNVTYTFKDSAQNAAICRFGVKITDNENPSWDGCPSGITQNAAPDTMSATVSWTPPTARDNNNDLIKSSTSTANPGDSFAVGTTTVTYTAWDLADNQAQCEFTVTVVDNQNPVAQCPNPVTKPTDAGVSTAVLQPAALGTVTVSDNDPAATIACVYPTGNVYVLGLNTVQCTATDTQGNTDTCSITVTIEDEEAPVFTTCPESASADTELNTLKASVPFAVTAIDNVGAVVTCVAKGATVVSGAEFQKGTTTVTCTARDLAGHTAECIFPVTVVDRQPPSVLCSTDQPRVVATGTGQSTRYLSPLQAGVATATDNDSANVECDYPDDNIYVLGVNTIVCEARDPSDNVAQCEFEVTVEDREDPVISCAVTAVADTDPDSVQASVTFVPPPHSTDNVGSTMECTDEDGNAVVSGDAFQLGITNITCTAVDAAGHEAVCFFDVVVNDNQVPLITCPEDHTQNTDPTEVFALIDPSVLGVAQATDNDAVTATCVYANADKYVLGENPVRCEGVDPAGNRRTCTFTVHVEDHEDPVITGCPEDIEQNTDPSSPTAIVTWQEPGATDNVGLSGPPVQTYIPGWAFPVGDTTVTYTFSDVAGNQAVCTFVVSVVDLEAPVLQCPANVHVSVASSLDEAIVVEYEGASCTDNVACTVAYAGPASGSSFPLGATTISATASDGSHNTATCSFIVHVYPPFTITCPPHLSVCNDPFEEFSTEQLEEAVTSVAPADTVISSVGALDQYPLGATSVSFSASSALLSASAECAVEVKVHNCTCAHDDECTNARMIEWVDLSCFAGVCTLEEQRCRAMDFEVNNTCPFCKESKDKVYLKICQTPSHENEDHHIDHHGHQKTRCLELDSIQKLCEKKPEEVMIGACDQPQFTCAEYYDRTSPAHTGNEAVAVPGGVPSLVIASVVVLGLVVALGKRFHRARKEKLEQQRAGVEMTSSMADLKAGAPEAVNVTELQRNYLQDSGEADEESELEEEAGDATDSAAVAVPTSTYLSAVAKAYETQL